MFREERRPDYLHMFRNFSPENFLRVFNAAGWVVGNTSSSIREGAFLGVPAVNIGHRQMGRERSDNVMDVGHNTDEIERAIRAQLAHGRYSRSTLYGDGRAGMRIASILGEIPMPPIQKSLVF